jgi:aspartate/methionine/tyrosine aminotransferase
MSHAPGRAPSLATIMIDHAAAFQPTSQAAIRPEALNAPDSGIVEVFNYGLGRTGLIPLWVGEGDMATPAFIAEAATRSLAAGETFYTWQRGHPDLRNAISAYMSRLYGRALQADRFNVTIGGMHALQLAMRIAAGAGDEAIVPTPAWPNFTGALTAGGVTPVEVPMSLVPHGNGSRWFLDIDRVAAAITPRTRVIVVNSPANPTGWTATRDELIALLDLARRHGMWIISDEIYGRFVYGAEARAPSFHDIMDETDRILFVQTLSKNWAMTGWRVGWLECHPTLGGIIENLIQYSCSGVPVFVQRGATAALMNGESLVEHQLAKARRGREIVCALAETGRVAFAEPAGAFYLFFSVQGQKDTRAFAMRLVDEANVGLAPGSAFGSGGESFLRLCFARKASDLEEATRRLANVIAAA